MHRIIAASWLGLYLCSSWSMASVSKPWGEFRGPSGQGHAAVQQLPLQWSAEKNVAWKLPVPGQGWSSPVLDDRAVYLTLSEAGVDGSPLSLRVVALDKQSGKIRWNTKIFEPVKVPGIHSKNSQASPTPILAGDKIYVHFGHFGTACLNTAGAIVWTQNQLGYSPVHGNGGSPVLAGDRLIFSCDGGEDPFLAALSTNDGKLLWKVRRNTNAQKTFSFSTPLLIDVRGEIQVVSPGSGVVGGFDPSDGREIWRVRYGEGYSVVPRPVLAHGLLFIGTGYDRPSVLAIRIGGAGDVTESHVAWKTTRGAPNTPSMLVVGELLYMVSDGGIMSCLDAKTGAEIWQERLGGNVSASPVFAGNRIYVQTEEGVGVVVKPGRSFEKLASNPLGERTLASYAVEEGAIYIRTAQHLFKIRE